MACCSQDVPAKTLFLDEIGIASDLDAKDRHDIDLAVAAVWDALGLSGRDDDRGTAVAQGIVETWRTGQRLPLNLVRAGLEAAED